MWVLGIQLKESGLAVEWAGPGPLEDFFYFHYKNIVVKITLENSMNLSNFRVAMVQEATITRILYFPLL